MCLLRNLSYQVHREIPGCERYQEAVPLNQGPAPSSQKGGCFSSRKSKGLCERGRDMYCAVFFLFFFSQQEEHLWFCHCRQQCLTGLILRRAQTKHVAHTGMSTISPTARKLILSPAALCLCFTESIDLFFPPLHTPSPLFYGFH